MTINQFHASTDGMRVKVAKEVVALLFVTTGACKGYDNAECRIWGYPRHKVAFGKETESLEGMYDADESFAVSLISKALKPIGGFVKCVV